MSLKLLTNNRDAWDAFSDHVLAEIQKTYIEMERADGETFRKYQGEVTALRRLLKLKDQINHEEKQRDHSRKP